MQSPKYSEFMSFGPDAPPETLKYMRIVNKIVQLITERNILNGDFLPSINEMIKLTGYSRDTILTAYRKLQELGYIQALHGKGFYVSVSGTTPQIPVFLLFDVMNGYKEVLYRSFVENLGINYRVDIYFHYYNQEVFENLIREKNSQYSFYVIMPHFNTDVSRVVQDLPSGRILLIDNDIPALKKKVAAIYQNFEKDIYAALTEGIDLLKKYKQIFLIKNTRFQFIPDGMVRGFCHFCEQNKIKYNLIPDVRSVPFIPGNAYIAVADNDLISVIRMAKEQQFVLGEEIGLISYDETPLKEVLAGGITVISTDFKAMGEIAASLVKDPRPVKIENKCFLIRRKTL
jgi:DNA-binding LacI/PurR family transcriptional regulator